MTTPHPPPALPGELSAFAQDILRRYRTTWEMASTPAGATGTKDLGKLTVHEEGGLQLLALNTSPYAESARRPKEGLPMASLCRLEVAAGFPQRARAIHPWPALPQWCYQVDGGGIELLPRFQVDTMPRSASPPWKAPVPVPFRFADSQLKLVEKLAFFLDLKHRRHNELVVWLGRRMGATVAAAIGARKVPEPGDSVHTFWRGEQASLHDGALDRNNADECWIWLGAEGRSLLATVVHLAVEAGVSLQITTRSYTAVEARQPGEAPRLDEVGRQNNSGSLNLEDDGQTNHVFVEDSPEGPIVHQIRAWQGRVTLWERFGEFQAEVSDYCLATEHFAAKQTATALSPRALEWVRRHNVFHYPQLCASEQVLQQLFADAGLQLTPAHVELERAMGGIVIRGPDGKIPQPFGLGLHAQWLPKHVLLSASTSLRMDGYLTVAPDGTLMGGDAVEGSVPLASHWRHFLERRAIGYDSVRCCDERIGNLGIGRGRCSVLFSKPTYPVSEPIGPALAQYLGIPESQLQSDKHNFFAEDADTVIWCPLSQAGRGLLLDDYACELVTNDLDRVVQALKAAPLCSPGVHADLNGPFEDEEICQQPIAPPRAITEGAVCSFELKSFDQAGTVYVLGEPGNLRLEVVSKGQWCAHRWCTFTAKRNTLRFTPGS